MEGTSRIGGDIPTTRQKVIYNKLLKDEEKGFKGKNGFYMAVMKENKAREKTMVLAINLERMLATPSWVVDIDFNPDTAAAVMAAAGLGKQKTE